jgi:hypothetical protein
MERSEDFAPDFRALLDFLACVPSIVATDAHGFGSGAGRTHWWVKFSLNLNDPLAWNVVQELAHVLNYLSVDEKLPTSFYPVSPPPYLNGGPKQYLSWVIECPLGAMHPSTVADLLKSRLPDPVDDLTQWAEEPSNTIQ